MLTFIIHHANFCPNIVHIPKEDFPQEYYDELIKNSKAEEGDKHILYHLIKWDGPGGERINVDWTHIIDKMDTIYEYLTDDPNYLIPDWAVNAMIQRHRFFNSDLIETNNETFVVKEMGITEDKDGTLRYRVNNPSYDTVDEFLDSYLKQYNKNKWTVE